MGEPVPPGDHPGSREEKRKREPDAESRASRYPVDSVIRESQDDRLVVPQLRLRSVGTVDADGAVGLDAGDSSKPRPSSGSSLIAVPSCGW